MDDAKFLNEIKRGNADAYKEIFIKYYSPLCEYGSQFVSNEHAEELVQNLMLYVWEERANLTVEVSLKSYLFAAVRNRSLNAIRDRKYRQNIHTLLYEKIKERFESPDYYMVDELADKIQEAVAELPDKYRETFEMSRFGMLTNTRIAEELNLSIKTVEYRISQALRILRVKLKDHLVILAALLG